MLGGKGRYIATTIEEYERVDIGAGYFAYIFKNPQKNIWHIAQADCGALIGADSTKSRLLKKTRKDVEGGDLKEMNAQIKQGKKDCERAEVIDSEKFFSYFSLHRDE